MEADLGGTELLPALQSVLEQAASAELPRQVVILTDGQVTNTDASSGSRGACLDREDLYVRHRRRREPSPGARSRACRRRHRGVHLPGERIEPKVLRQVARLLSPALTDVCVEWVGGDVTQAPVKIPPVFAGGRLLVYGFVKGARPSNVRLAATSPSGPLSFDVPVPELVPSSRRTVATLAARARIRELEEGSEWLTARGSQQKDRKACSAGTRSSRSASATA